MTSSLVVIVDGYSSGQFFAPRLRQRGYRVAHLQSSADMSAGVAAYFSDIKDAYGDLYEAWIVHKGDLAATLAAVRALSPVAIWAGSESGVELADAVAEALRLPGNGTALSAARRDKVKMQAALRAAGVPAMAFHEAVSLEDLKSWARGLGRWPVVVKPVKSAGTEGLHFCRDENELAKAWNELAGTRDFFGGANASVLAEECLDGVEHVVNTVSLGGRPYLSELWQYRKIRIPGVAAIYDCTRLLPCPAPGSPLAALVDYTFQAITALGITHGPAHSEVMLTPQGPRLIETGARVMGGSFPQDLIASAVGHNQVDWTIDCHLAPEKFEREAAAPYRLRRHLMLKCLISHRSGKLLDLPALDLLRQLPSVQSGNFTHVIESEHISATVDLFTTPGLLVLAHENPEVLEADYRTIADLEEEAEEQLFTLEGAAPAAATGIASVPEEIALANEAAAEAEAALIRRCLGLRPGEEVLDCPCRDGRIAAALARTGVRLVGVDLETDYITQARRRFRDENLPGEFLALDMRKLHFTDRFDAVVNWGASFGLFTRDEEQEILRRFAAALKPGGRLLVESPSRRRLFRDLRRLDRRGVRVDAHWDPEDEAIDGDLHRSRDGSVAHFHRRIYTPGECRLLMRLIGLRIEGIFDETGGESDPQAERTLIVARKPL